MTPSRNFIPDLVFLFALPVLCAFPSRAADYEGTVGRLEAVFSLTWESDGRVHGTYSYPSRPDITYTLRGSNPEEGKLYLEEFTGSDLSARCHLSKKIEEGRITWAGTMNNTDGRKLPMRFSRVAAAPAPPTATAADVSRYSGNVGRLAAEYALTWHGDRTVTGSYSYPDRPGTTYRLEGSNPREGELYLVEYTGDRITARCNLAKTLTDGEIIWAGTMHNTDGRRLPMRLSRNRDRVAVDAGEADDYEAMRAALMKRIVTEANWETFPRADTPVEMVPVSREGQEYFVAIVNSFRSEGGRISLTFTVGNWDGDGEITYDGPEVTLRMNRSLPLASRDLVGKSITVQVDRDGKLADVELCGIGVTHARVGAGGKLEVRGVLETDEMAELHDATPEEIRRIAAKAPAVEFLPDKLSLGWAPTDEIFFQSIRLTPDYGIVVHATAAGPGMLELETLSLEAPAPQNPWIEIGSPEATLEVPPSQHTIGAG